MVGLLFGSQNGLDVSIYDAMEVACTAVGTDGLELNEALVEKQKDLCESPTAAPLPVPAVPTSCVTNCCRIFRSPGENRVRSRTDDIDSYYAADLAF